jgi:FkbM family methyltransferase
MGELSLIGKLLVWYGTHFPNHPRKWWLHEHLRHLFGVCPDVPIEVKRHGLNWILNPADYTDSSLFWLDSRDDEDMRCVQQLVTPGAVICDIGANYGYYSLSLAAALKRRCHIYSIEPDPDNYKRLCDHISLNNMNEIVEAYSVGVSDRSETVSMHRPKANSGHSAVNPNGKNKGINLGKLDDFFNEHQIEQCDLLFLDVEGYEERALCGAKSTISRCRPIIFVELFPPVMKSQGSSPQSVAGILGKYDYQIYFNNRGSLELLLIMPSGDERINAFCFPVESLPKKVEQ